MPGTGRPPVLPGRVTLNRVCPLSHLARRSHVTRSLLFWLTEIKHTGLARRAPSVVALPCRHRSESPHFERMFARGAIPTPTGHSCPPERSPIARDNSPRVRGTGRPCPGWVVCPTPPGSGSRRCVNETERRRRGDRAGSEPTDRPCRLTRRALHEDARRPRERPVAVRGAPGCGRAAAGDGRYGRSVFRMAGSFSWSASTSWHMVQSWEMVLPEASVCCSSWQRQQPGDSRGSSRCGWPTLFG